MSTQLILIMVKLGKLEQVRFDLFQGLGTLVSFAVGAQKLRESEPGVRC